MNPDIYSIRETPLEVGKYYTMNTLPQYNVPPIGTVIQFINGRLKRIWVLRVAGQYKKSNQFSTKVLKEL